MLWKPCNCGNSEQLQVLRCIQQIETNDLEPTIIGGATLTRHNIVLSQIRDYPFRRLLRLAGLRWRYSTPPLHGIDCNC
jgi:hypothetical protein